MCGRFAVTSPPEALRRAFGYAERPNFPPRYNVAPTQPVGLVIGPPRRASARHRGVAGRTGARISRRLVGGLPT